MQKKLTITLNEQVYHGLKEVIGPGKISHFIEELVRPYVEKPNLDSAYKKMADDEKREGMALEWSETMIEEVVDEAW